MRALKIKSFGVLWLFLSLIFGLVSCIKDDIQGGLIDNEPLGIKLSISLPEPIEKKNSGSRAGVADFNTISNLNIIVATENSIERVYYLPSFTEIDDASISLKPVSSDKATVEIKDLYPSSVDVYLVANYNEEITVSTVDDLKNLKQNGTMVGCMMYSKAEEKQGPSSDKRELSARLKRTVAMVSIVLEDKGLAEGVEIEPMRISLHNVPKSCMLGNSNKIENEDNLNTNGEWADVPGWKVLGQGEVTSVGSHDRNNIEDQYFEPLFLFENLQGDNETITDEKQKNPNKNKYASYVKIDARYYSREKNVYGTVSFKFCLGSDIVSNFDVRRNTHYKVTLGLKGYVVTEGGQIDNNGNLITNPSDKTWRVDTELDDISFTSNTNVVNQGGGIIMFKVEGEQSGQWAIDAEDNKLLIAWVWKDSQNAWHSISEKKYEIDIKDGFIPIFIQGEDPDVNNTNLSFKIRLYRNGKLEKEIPITRYASKKITMNIDGKSETFYVDAVDRVPIAWGYDDVVFEETEDPRINGLNGFTITELLMSKYVDKSKRYMPLGTSYSNGSVMMAASYMDLFPNGSTGQPTANFNPFDESKKELPDVINNKTRKYFYTIPSIAQWQAIEKQMNDLGIGPDAEDENCRLKPFVQYWTANHATSGFGSENGRLYSYTYEINRGYDSIKQGEPYYSYSLRTRMLPYRCIIVRNPKWG